VQQVAADLHYGPYLPTTDRYYSDLYILHIRLNNFHISAYTGDKPELTLQYRLFITCDVPKS